MGQVLRVGIGPVAGRDRGNEGFRPSERSIDADVVGGRHRREDPVVIGGLDDLGAVGLPVDLGDGGVLRLRGEINAKRDQGSLWMSSTQWTCSGFGSTSGRSRLTTTGSCPERTRTHD